MIAVLFDIDGTILHSNQVGAGAFYEALDTIWPEYAPIPRTLSFAGATDLGLLHGLHAEWGAAWEPERVAAFFDEMAEQMQLRLDPANMTLLPGARELIQTLDARNDVSLGLLTGNTRAGAYIKLSAFALGDFFSWGGFGDEHPDRREMARLALDRGTRLLNGRGLRHAVVIGDTPSDIAGARAVGARAVCVSTGTFADTVLREAGADAVFDSLADPEVLSAIGLT